jgi:hypothetical protein
MKTIRLVMCLCIASLIALATMSVHAWSAPPDPCALVSQADAEKLSGKKMQDAGRSAATCAYGPPQGGLPKVEVYVGDPAQRFLTIEQNQNRKFRTLSGAGDEAFISDAAGLLFVKKSNVLTAVRFVTLSDEKEYRKRFEELASVIATRL